MNLLRLFSLFALLICFAAEAQSQANPSSQTPSLKDATITIPSIEFRGEEVQELPEDADWQEQLDERFDPNQYHISFFHTRSAWEEVGDSVTSRVSLRFHSQTLEGLIREQRYFGDSQDPLIFERELTPQEISLLTLLLQRNGSINASHRYRNASREVFRLSARNGNLTIDSDLTFEQKPVFPVAVVPQLQLSLKDVLTQLYQSVGASEDTFEAINLRFNDYNRDHDDEIEITELVSMDKTQIVKDKPLVLVLVDTRLLSNAPRKDRNERSIYDSLNRYAHDLQLDGYQAKLVLSSIYSGQTHQDGLTVLALRDYFITIKEQYPQFEGVVLVGSFPDALIVRRFHWWRDSDTINEKTVKANFFRSEPEIIADKADIVLADLDGNWQNIYHQEERELTSFRGQLTGLARLQNGISSFEAGPFVYSKEKFEDFFFVNDSQVSVACTGCAKTYFTPSTSSINAEVSKPDASKSNPVARPEIKISRIDARHAAVTPIEAAGYLDAHGRPQRAAVAEGDRGVALDDLWVWDFELERKLITDFFDRNHNYRKGIYTIDGAAAITSPSFRLTNDRFTDLSSVSDGNLQVKEKATIGEYAAWVDDAPAIRHIVAHASGSASMFGKTSWETLSTQVHGAGDTPFAWDWENQETQDVVIPTLARFLKPNSDDEVQATFHLYRSQWETYRRHLVGEIEYMTPIAFYSHEGCQVVSPAGARNTRYNVRQYGKHQNAESLLFYGHGLILLGRSKVFNDFPNEYYKDLAQGKSFGEAWESTFEYDSNLEWSDFERNYGDELEVTNSVRRKKSYPWNLLGDWTLNFRPSNIAVKTF